MTACLIESFLSLRIVLYDLFTCHCTLLSSNDKNVYVEDGIWCLKQKKKCIFAVVGLGFIDSVNRYFVYKAIMCCQVEVVVLQYFKQGVCSSM